jgi:N-methylhydantoinase B
MMNALNMVGTGPDGRPFSTLFFASGALGAMKGQDGLSATPAPASMMTMPAETWETLTGVTMVERHLRPDSGGAGEWRGGLGQRIVLRNDTASPVHIAILGSRTDYPAQGFHGGQSGGKRYFEINGKTVHPKGRYQLSTGDVLTINDAGGGGYGNPENRDPAKLSHDVAEGFVSPEGAARDYGRDNLSVAAE